jgi:cell surface protein SprA
VPLQHFPLLDFAQVRAQYNATYSWSAAALNVDSLGNVIQNTQARQISADFNFEKLYNKIPYLRKINQGRRTTTTTRRQTTRPERPGQEGDEKKKEARDPGAIERLFIRPLMALRKAKFQYSENLGSVIPGFTPKPRFFGIDRSWSAPGTPFILGWQPDQAWFDESILPENNWITDNIFLNQEVLTNNTKKWNASVSIEPFQDFRLEVSMDYSFTENHSEFFKKANPDSPFEHLAPREVGSFNISYFALNTLFDQDIGTLFQKFEETRPVISQRVGDPNSSHEFDGDAYTAGFGKYQRDVLIPAFISTYADIAPNDVKLDIFDLAPKPNWQLTYNGLSKVPLFKDIFSSVSLTHGYRSTLSINNYNTDFDYAPNDPAVNLNNVTGDFYSRYEIPAIIVNEQFSPLLAINIKTRNGVSLRVDMNKTRNLSLSFTDYQLNETKRTDYVVGFGYQLKNVNIPFLQGKRSKSRRRNDPEPDPDAPGSAKKGNDMEIKFDLQFSDNVSLIHKFDTELEEQASRGTKQLRISPSIDYEVSETLTLRFFFDYNRTEPYTSRSYPITNINSGVTVRFALQ